MYALVRLVRFDRADPPPFLSRLLDNIVFIILFLGTVIFVKWVFLKEAGEGIFSGDIGNRVPQRRNVDRRTVGFGESKVRFAKRDAVDKMLAVGIDLIAARDVAGTKFGLSEVSDAEES